MKGLLSLVTLLVLFLTTALAAEASDFYKGTGIRLIVASTPGGGSDSYSRLIARHLGQYIPGDPPIIVQNMPGAGGLRAANYIYQRAPRDGTVIGNITWNIWNYQLIEDPRAKFDFDKMNAVGAPIVAASIFYCRKDRFANFEDLRKSAKSGKLPTVGVSGRNSGAYINGAILEQSLDTQLFNMVLGYPGAREFTLALRQGEVDCSALIVDAFWNLVADMYKAGKLVVIAQSGTVEGKRDKAFANVPMIKELPKTRKGKELAESAYFLGQYGIPYVLPPNVPRERVNLLRQSFWKALHDARLLHEAARLRRRIDPVGGQKLKEIWKSALNPSPTQFQIVRRIFGTQH